MKLSVFKKLIREVVREELDYSFSRLRKELKEIVVKSNTTGLDKVTSKATKVKRVPGYAKFASSSNSNVSIPKIKDKVLNQMLVETAQSDDWKSIESESETKSVMDDTSGLPDHLAKAFNKDYSDVMKKVDEKTRF